MIRQAGFQLPGWGLQIETGEERRGREGKRKREMKEEEEEGEEEEEEPREEDEKEEEEEPCGPQAHGHKKLQITRDIWLGCKLL